MKKLIISVISLIVCLSFSAQEYQIYYDDSGKPFRFKVWDEETVEVFKLDGIPENGLFNFTFNGIDMTLDLEEFCNPDRTTNSRGVNYAMDYIEPGFLPEGDLISAMKYTPDGSLLAVLCHHSNNIYFYNAETWEIEAIVDVCSGAVDIAFTNEQAFVACKTSQEVTVINLEDFSFEKSFSIEQEEVVSQIEVKSDGSMVFVAYYSWLNGGIGAFDPVKGVEVYYTQQPYINRWSTIGSIRGRTLDQVVEFTLSPNNEVFIAPNTSGHDPTLFDANTGELVWWITPDSFRGVNYSPSGDTLYLLTDHSGYDDQLTLWRLDCNNYSVIDTLGSNLDDFFSYTDLVVSNDRNKVLALDDWNNIYFYFDLEKHSCEHLVEPYLIRGPRIFYSQKHKLAFPYLSRNYRVIDLENGAVLQTISSSYNKERIGVVSPNGDKLLVTNITGLPLTNGKSDEGFYIYDITDKDNITLDTAIIAGVEPEADGTTCAALSLSGEWLYVVNSLTSNLSIIDYESGEVDTLIYLPGIQNIETIPNSELIILSGIEAVKVYLFDPLKYNVVKDFDLIKINSVFCSNDGQHAFAFYRAAFHGTLFKIDLDGENSAVIDDIYFRVKSCPVYFLWEGGENDTKIGISPDKKYVLSGQEDQEGNNSIQVIDTDLMEIVSTIDVDDGCVMEYAFTSDLHRAYAVRRMEPDLIIYLDGENSYIENEVQNEENSYSATYNPDEDYFYVLNKYLWYHKVDPKTGEIVESVETDNYSCWQIAMDADKLPVIRQSYSLLYEGTKYPLTGVSKGFSYDANNNLFIIPIPGPDAVNIFNPFTVSIETYPKQIADPGIQLGPNPAGERITVFSEKPFQKVEIIDAQGKLVYSGNFNNRKTTIPVLHLEQGVYVVRVHSGEKSETKKLIVSR